jgi:branched-chain amino acid transport system substrate-binding protein
MSPQLTKIKTAPGVQAVFVFGLGQGPAIVTKNYKQLGITLPLYHVARRRFRRVPEAGRPGCRRCPPAVCRPADR